MTSPSQPRGADFWLSFVVFVVAAVVLVPFTIYAGARELGAEPLVAAIAAGAALAVGLRLARWWMKTAKRPR